MKFVDTETQARAAAPTQNDSLLWTARQERAITALLLQCMDGFTAVYASIAIVFVGLAAISAFLWFKHEHRQIHHGKVTSSTARLSGPRIRSPSRPNSTAGPGRLIQFNHRPVYASHLPQVPNGHLNLVKHSNYHPNRSTNREYYSEELHYRLPTPIRASAESSPLHSPYVPHAKPPIRFPADHEPQSLLPSYSTPHYEQQLYPGWQSAELTRTTLCPSDMGSHSPYTLGSSDKKGQTHTQPEKPVQLPSVEEIRDSYRPPGQMAPMRIGGDLIGTFASLTEGNTAKNVETVGILAGFRSDSNEFVLTHLIVPDQHGTHDTCEVLNDEIMPGILAEHDLLQLGWIHVHPKYDAFLSSIDLHTHFSYQMMLPESIAIVWAPTSDPNYGIFSLTRTGMKMIENCTRRGFHTHPSDSLSFESATHVHVDHMLPNITIIDLRKT